MYGHSAFYTSAAVVRLPKSAAQPPPKAGSAAGTSGPGHVPGTARETRGGTAAPAEPAGKQKTTSAAPTGGTEAAIAAVPL